MAFFVKTQVDAEPLSIGVVEEEILAPLSCVGEDLILLLIENTSAETFDGRAYSAPSLTGPWTAEANDEFQSIPPNTARRMVLPADRLNVRILGNFQLAPGTLELTVVLLRSAVRRG